MNVFDEKIVVWMDGWDRIGGLIVHDTWDLSWMKSLTSGIRGLIEDGGSNITQIMRDHIWYVN